MSIWFYLYRPKKDFIDQVRAPGNLKADVRNQFMPSIPDIDNLAKFVLDALNKVLYQDDKQIVKLTCYKLRDNHDLCLGSTRFTIEPFPW